MSSHSDTLTFVPSRKHAPPRGRMILGQKVPLHSFTYCIPAKKKPPETPRPSTRASTSRKVTTELSNSESRADDLILSPWPRSTPVSQKTQSRRSSTRLDQPGPNSSDNHNNVALNSGSSDSTIEYVPLAHHPQPPTNLGRKRKPQAKKTAKQRAAKTKKPPETPRPSTRASTSTKVTTELSNSGSRADDLILSPWPRSTPVNQKTQSRRSSTSSTRLDQPGPSSSHNHNNVALNSGSSDSTIEYVPLAHHRQPSTNLRRKKKPQAKKTAKRGAAKTTRATHVKIWEEEGTKIAPRDVIDLDVILAMLIETKDEISNELTSTLQRETAEKYFDKIIRELKETAAKAHKLQQLRHKKKALIKEVEKKSEQLLKLSIENLRHKHEQINPNDVHMLSQ